MELSLESGQALNNLIQTTTLVRSAMASVMQPEVHYGKIPGTSNKTLLKPGAEKICVLFGFRAEIHNLKRTDLPGGHREYEMEIQLYSVSSGKWVSSGLGLCSTMESKYRYRGVHKESTGIELPRDYWSIQKSDPVRAKQILREVANANGIDGTTFDKMKDENDKWVIAFVGEKMENPDIADTYNTVLKMAEKRALVSAVLKATGAGDLFTEEIDTLTYLNNMQEVEYTEAETTPEVQTAQISAPQEPVNNEVVKLQEYAGWLTVEDQAVMLREIKSGIKADRIGYWQQQINAAYKAQQSK